MAGEIATRVDVVPQLPTHSRQPRGRALNPVLSGIRFIGVVSYHASLRRSEEATVRSGNLECQRRVGHHEAAGVERHIARHGTSLYAVREPVS